MEEQEEYFDKAYYWIDIRTERISEWLDKHFSRPLDLNIGRILIVAGALLVATYGFLEPEGSPLNSISPELIGIVLTAVVVDYVNQRRQAAERKHVLIAQLASSQRDVTEGALIELRQRGWLSDGSLKGVDLSAADLSGARLHFADLGGSVLREVSLGGAILLGTNLSKARLWGVNAEGAALWGTNLEGSDLWAANLSNASLHDANLSEASLRRANLSGVGQWTIEALGKSANLAGTVMPDGVRLRDEESSFEGPTFTEWKELYLAENGGEEADIRDDNLSIPRYSSAGNF